MDDALRLLLAWCEPESVAGGRSGAGGARTTPEPDGASAESARAAALEAVARTRQRSLADFLE